MNIRNSISLQDRMTPTLRSILKAMDSTVRAMQQADKASNAAGNNKAWRQAEKDIQRANNELIRMRNYADAAGNSVASGAQRSIREMNLLQAATYGVSRALREVNSSSAAAARGGRLRNMFSSMSSLGSSMRAGPDLRGAGLMSRIAGSALEGLGALGGKGLDALGKVGNGARLVGKWVGNSFKDLGALGKSAFQSIASQADISWQKIAAGIYTIKNVASALSNLAEIMDGVTSDIAKLDLQNYSGLTKTQEYGLAYQAAQNSRSDLSTTSQLASRIAMSGVYGKEKGSLEKSLNMAETLQKALVVGGGTSEENRRALTQLSQGLASGVLQGDELRSIREQSPYLADVLAEGLAKVDKSFIGTTAGDLKQLGADGKLTSDVVIAAFEAMEGQIDETFDTKAPKTWGQGVTAIANTIKFAIGILQQMEDGPLQKIAELVWTIAEYMQSEQGMQVLAAIATVLSIIGDVLSFVVNLALQAISWVIENAYILVAVLLVVAAVALATAISVAAGWIMANLPILLVIAAVALLIKIFLDMGFTFNDIVGGICGGVMVILSFFKNLGLAIWGIIKGIWAVLVGLVNNTGLAFQNVGLGIQSFFAGIVSTVLGFIAKIAEALNKLPFVEFDYSGLASAAEDWAGKKAAAEAEIAANNAKKTDLGAAFSEAYSSVGAFSEGWASDAYDSGFQWGSGLVDKVGNTFDSLSGAFNPDTLGASLDLNGVEMGGGDLDSVGSVGSIDSDVDISDEDVKLLRDMAARDYLLQMQSVTPVAHVTFGDVRETADVNKIVDVIEQMVEEQMATALVS